MSISKAGLEMRIHRTTIHRWLKANKINRYDRRFVDLDEIQRARSQQHMGRKCGYAYPHYEPNPHEDIESILDRGIKIIASVWRHARNPEQRHWIKRQISRLNDEEYLRGRLKERPVIEGRIINGELIENGGIAASSNPMLFEKMEYPIHKPKKPKKLRKRKVQGKANIRLPQPETNGILGEPAKAAVKDKEQSAPMVPSEPSAANQPKKGSRKGNIPDDESQLSLL